jgi:hypothetical protein
MISYSNDSKDSKNLILHYKQIKGIKHAKIK